MKYLYVLTSDASDYYLEQALLSIISMRIQMPKAFISLLIDDITEANLSGKRSEIRNHIDELISIRIEERFNKKARSRFLKTSMREYITGDFLFIDGDTIIAEDLSDIDNIDINLGAVLNKHSLLPDLSKKKLQKRRDIDTKLGFLSSTKSDIHYNSGVMLCKDCTSTHNFFKEWHKLWLHCFEREQMEDQPSLNQVNFLLGNPVKELEGKWNCQISEEKGIVFFHDAKIIHYFSFTRKGKAFLLANQDTIESIKETGVVSEELRGMTAKSKNFLSDNARLMVMDKITIDFHDSAIYSAANRFYKTKIGGITEFTLSTIRRNIFAPIRKKKKQEIKENNEISLRSNQ